MVINRTYYLIKPYIPRTLRLALRRLRANRMRSSHADVWPIDPQAAKVPSSWPGWPDGQRFALVLTHDVESEKGLSRVKQLMDLELRHGFNSSFNFVPQDEYRVPDNLRMMLDHSGFEVGVHGLRHDGKLYVSKSGFYAQAAKIREYLAHWMAAGFRSPLMQHRLSWLHELGVEYDSSIFDTDPFEPEPDGARTIFPFWVPGANGGGYVELPYTLPQDFTLFVLFREPRIDIWKQKLDWLVEHGGMALVLTHPDYMCFNGGKKARDEYPVSFYEELLDYINVKYKNVCWTALPRDIARYYRASIPEKCRNSRKKICMLGHTVYESDNRVRRYAETLAARGDHVDVISITGNGSLEPSKSTESLFIQ